LVKDNRTWENGGGYLFLLLSTNDTIAMISVAISIRSCHVMYAIIPHPSMQNIEEGKKISRSSKRGSDRRRLGNSYVILSDPSSIIADVCGFVNIF
jgi:hypothetical protein